MKTEFLYFLCAIFAVCPGPIVRAADTANSPIRPGAQPIAVARANRPDALEAILRGRQFVALGVDRLDYSGRLPGLNARLVSARGFLAMLAAGDADSFWLCLAQTGSSLAQLAGAAGWNLPERQAGGEILSARLTDFFPELDRLFLTTAPAGGSRAALSLSRNADDLSAITGGTGIPVGEWQESLDVFFRTGGDGLGLWLNPRPILGMAALLLGMDFRQSASRFHMDPPRAIVVEVDAPDGNPGFRLELQGMLRTPLPGPSASLGLSAPRPENRLLLLTLADPSPALKALGLDRNPLFPAGLDLAFLIPRAMQLTLWRDVRGAIRWSLACLMPEGKGVLRQLPRLAAWADILAASRALDFSVEETADRPATRRIRFGSASVIASLAAGDYRGQSHSLVLFAGRPEDLPDAAAIAIVPADAPALLSWETDFDAGLRADAAGIFARQAERLYPAVAGAKDLEAVFPATERGEIRVIDKTLRLSFPSATPFWYGPFLADALWRLRDDLRRDPAFLAAERLRLLLDIAHQSRFRQAGPGNLTQRSLPADMADFPHGDAGGRRWLERVFPNFPGHYQSTAAVLADLEAGKRLDGFVYRIVLEEEGWFILADGGKIRLRLDNAGVLYRSDAGGEWRRRNEFDPFNTPHPPGR